MSITTSPWTWDVAITSWTPEKVMWHSAYVADLHDRMDILNGGPLGTLPLRKIERRIVDVIDAPNERIARLCFEYLEKLIEAYIEDMKEQAA